MDADDKFTSDILAALACLPYEKQSDGLRIAISHALKHMSTQRLREMQHRIDVELDTSVPAVRSTLEVVEGQLALREIAAGAYWR